MTAAELPHETAPPNRLAELARSTFSAVGILPILLIIVVIFFASQEARFYGAANITNVLRQSTFLIIVTLGQALVLISGGFDLSVGAVIAVTSVVSARYMATFYTANPESEMLAVLVGVAAGLLVGLIFGLINGIGVARFKVSPFIMTLGMASVGGGFALWYTGGSPVSGMPPFFTREIGTGRWFEIPVPIYVTIIAAAIVLFLVSSTSWGRYLYAIGGNTKAAFLSGIPVAAYTASVYVMCSVLAALPGLLLPARTATATPTSASRRRSTSTSIRSTTSLRDAKSRRRSSSPTSKAPRSWPSRARARRCARVCSESASRSPSCRSTRTSPSSAMSTQ